MEVGDGLQPPPSPVRRRRKRIRERSVQVEAVPSPPPVNDGKRLRLSAADHSPPTNQSLKAGGWQWAHQPPSPVRRHSARKRKARIIFSPEKAKVRRVNDVLRPSTPSIAPTPPSQPSHTQKSLVPTNQSLKAGDWQWAHPPPRQ